jgi:hypothetical protein
MPQNRKGKSEKGKRQKVKGKIQDYLLLFTFAFLLLPFAFQSSFASQLFFRKKLLFHILIFVKFLISYKFC